MANISTGAGGLRDDVPVKMPYGLLLSDCAVRHGHVFSMVRNIMQAVRKTEIQVRFRKDIRQKADWPERYIRLKGAYETISVKYTHNCILWKKHLEGSIEGTERVLKGL